MSQFNADNRMWHNLVSESLLNFPIANMTRVALLVKDLLPLHFNKLTSEEVTILRKLAKSKGLVDNQMHVGM